MVAAQYLGRSPQVFELGPGTGTDVGDAGQHVGKLGPVFVRAYAEGQHHAVIGVGINIASRDVTGLSTPPAALQALDPSTNTAATLLRVARPLIDAVQAFETWGFGPFQSRFHARDALRDRAVTLSDGTAGTAHGVSESGALLVHTSSGMHTVTSSEVSVRPSR